MNISVCENGHYLRRSDLLDVDEKFCTACGGKILNQCPNCGAPIKENENIIFATKYCRSCGKLYSWYAEDRKRVFPLYSEEEKLLSSNLDMKETLKKMKLLNDVRSGRI